MDKYRNGSHSRYDLKVRLAFVTQYRKQVLSGEIAKRAWVLIREVCLASEIQIVEGHISKDHVHLLLSYPPRLSHIPTGSTTLLFRKFFNYHRC